MVRRGLLMFSLLCMTGCVPFSILSGVSGASAVSGYADDAAHAQIADRLTEEGQERLIDDIMKALELDGLKKEEVEEVRRAIIDQMKKQEQARIISKELQDCRDKLGGVKPPKKILGVDHHGN